MTIIIPAFKTALRGKPQHLVLGRLCTSFLLLPRAWGAGGLLAGCPDLGGVFAACAPAAGDDDNEATGRPAAPHPALSRAEKSL